MVPHRCFVFPLQKQTEAAEEPAAQDNVAEEAIGSPLAMWESEVQNIELEKGEGGLGFSILDYQVRRRLKPQPPASEPSLTPSFLGRRRTRWIPRRR